MFCFQLGNLSLSPPHPPNSPAVLLTLHKLEYAKSLGTGRAEHRLSKYILTVYNPKRLFFPSFLHSHFLFSPGFSWFLCKYFVCRLIPFRAAGREFAGLSFSDCISSPACRGPGDSGVRAALGFTRLLQGEHRSSWPMLAMAGVDEWCNLKVAYDKTDCTIKLNVGNDILTV